MTKRLPIKRWEPPLSLGARAPGNKAEYIPWERGLSTMTSKMRDQHILISLDSSYSHRRHSVADSKGARTLCSWLRIKDEARC